MKFFVCCEMWKWMWCGVDGSGTVDQFRFTRISVIRNVRLTLQNLLIRNYAALCAQIRSLILILPIAELRVRF